MATRSINATLDRFILDAGTEITYLGMSLWKGATSDLIRAYRVTPGLNGYVIFTIEKSFGVLDMEIYQEDAYNSLSPLTGYSKYFSVLKAGKLKGAIGVNVRYNKTYIVLVRFETYQNAFYSGKVRIEDPLYLTAGATPALDLQFANNQSLVDVVSKNNLVTFTRASTGTYVDSTGTIQTAAVNTPRFTYDPVTGSSLGLLVEEQRTNSIRNNTMVGAVAGTPGTLPTNWGVSGLGTLTQQVVGTGTSNGISYVDIRLNGTTSTTQAQIRFDSSTAVAGLNGQTFTFSTWISNISGSTSNISAISTSANLYDSSAVYISSLVLAGWPAALSSTFTRFSGTGTIAQATAAYIQPQIYLSFASGVAIDITLRIGLPQLEQGAFATSVIPTTTAAATRNADVASITGTAFSSWYRQDEGTVFADTNNAGTSTAFCFSIHDGTQNNRLTQFRTTATIGSRHVVSGTANNPGDISYVGGTSARVKSTFSAFNSFAIAAANAVLSTSSTPSLMPTVNTLGIGMAPGSDFQLNGTIRRLTYWPSRLSNSTLQAITQ